MANDNRIHSTVYHKSDFRVNDIRRRCKKSDVISLYNIETMMLFRVEMAQMQFDMLNNHRPYILFQGKAEGVFLPESTGLLFPNQCDQLDFRTDFQVDAAITYELADVELATLAGNGLFNYDWSCQGRVIGSLLEIPCLIDYYAIANTPITFIEIQNRLNLTTSTRKTGYKTLVATFLPYSAQKHNAEAYPKLITAGEYNRDDSEIRKRAQYDSKVVGFKSEAINPRNAKSFVESAQARIEQKLRDQMEKANVLETNAAQTSKQITDAVDVIKAQAEKAKKQTLFEAEGNVSRLDVATLDARLNDMKTRMIYEGAQAIPVEIPEIQAQSLALHKAPGENDRTMTEPTTQVTLTPDAILEANKNIENAENIAKSQSDVQSDKPENNAETESATAQIDKHDDNIRQSVMDSEAVASDVKGKVLSRKDMLAQRRRQAIQAQKTQQQMIQAGEDEAKKGLTNREADIEILDAKKAAKQESKPVDAPKPKIKNQGDDILNNDIDIDSLINEIEK